MKRFTTWNAAIAMLLLTTTFSIGCHSSPTPKKLSKFAKEVCACADAACAKEVSSRYKAWWEENKRSKGGEGDRKDVEKALEKYALCYAKLVPEEIEAVLPAGLKVPEIDLRAPADPSKAAPGASSQSAETPSTLPATTTGAAVPNGAASTTKTEVPAPAPSPEASDPGKNPEAKVAP